MRSVNDPRLEVGYLTQEGERAYKGFNSPYLAKKFISELKKQGLIVIQEPFFY